MVGKGFDGPSGWRAPTRHGIVVQRYNQNQGIPVPKTHTSEAANNFRIIPDSSVLSLGSANSKQRALQGPISPRIFSDTTSEPVRIALRPPYEIMVAYDLASIEHKLKGHPQWSAYLLGFDAAKLSEVTHAESLAELKGSRRMSWCVRECRCSEFVHLSRQKSPGAVSIKLNQLRNVGFQTLAFLRILICLEEADLPVHDHSRDWIMWGEPIVVHALPPESSLRMKPDASEPALVTQLRADLQAAVVQHKDTKNKLEVAVEQSNAELAVVEKHQMSEAAENQLRKDLVAAIAEQDEMQARLDALSQVNLENASLRKDLNSAETEEAVLSRGLRAALQMAGERQAAEIDLKKKVEVLQFAEQQLQPGTLKSNLDMALAEHAEAKTELSLSVPRYRLDVAQEAEAKLLQKLAEAQLEHSKTKEEHSKIKEELASATPQGGPTDDSPAIHAAMVAHLALVKAEHAEIEIMLHAATSGQMDVADLVHEVDVSARRPSGELQAKATQLALEKARTEHARASELAVSLEKARTEYAAAQKELGSARTEHAEAKIELSSAVPHPQREAFEAERAQLMSRLDSAHEVAEEAKAALIEARKEHETTKTHLAQSKYFAAEEEQASLKSSLAEVNAEGEESSKEASPSFSQKRSSRKSLGHQDDSEERLQQRLERLQEEHTELHKDRNHHRKHAKDLKAELRASQVEHVKHKNDIKQVQYDCHKLNQIVEKQTEDLEESRKQLEAAWHQHNVASQVEQTLSQEREALRLDLRSALEMADEACNAEMKMTKKAKEHDAEKAALRKELKTATAQHSQAKAQLEKLEAQLKKPSRSETILKNNLELERDKVTKLQAELDKASAKQKDADDRSDDARSRQKTADDLETRKALSKAEAEKSELANRIEGSETERMELANRIESSEAERTELANRVERSEAERTELANRIALAESVQREQANRLALAESEQREQTEKAEASENKHIAAKAEHASLLEKYVEECKVSESHQERHDKTHADLVRNLSELEAAKKMVISHAETVKKLAALHENTTENHQASLEATALANKRLMTELQAARDGEDFEHNAARSAEHAKAIIEEEHQDLQIKLKGETDKLAKAKAEISKAQKREAETREELEEAKKKGKCGCSTM